MLLINRYAGWLLVQVNLICFNNYKIVYFSLQAVFNSAGIEICLTTFKLIA